jgi:hypothetical protein
MRVYIKTCDMLKARQRKGLTTIAAYQRAKGKPGPGRRPMGYKIAGPKGTSSTSPTSRSVA